MRDQTRFPTSFTLWDEAPGATSRRHRAGRLLQPLALSLSLSLALSLALALAACSSDGAAVTHDTAGGGDGAISTGDAAASDAPATPDAQADLPDDGPGDAGETSDATAPGDSQGDTPSPGCESAVDCDDGNPCTTDACVPSTGACLHQPVTVGTPCEDGDACTGPDQCQADGVCRGKPAVSCDDQDPCTTDACEPADGECVFTVVPGLPCDDGDPCTVADECGDGGTCAGASKGCDDGLGCSVDKCDAETGSCIYDMSGCACVSDLGCDDLNPCTADTCNLTTGKCTTTPLSSADDDTVACDDGDPCTSDDTCIDGVCVGTPVSCDDGVACTVDSCDASGACVHDEAPCECLSDADCDDDSPCTADTCGDDNTCTHTPNANAEGDACVTPTANGACLAGACRGVVEAAVGAHHACTRLATGAIRCWGAEDYGAVCSGVSTTGDALLDDPTETAAEVQGSGAPTAVEVPALPTMAAGEDFTCAIVGGAVRCWGKNNHRQLGVVGVATLDCAKDAGGAVTAPPSTVDLGSVDPAVSLVAGFAHACVVTAAGAVRCWGDNDQGQLGRGDKQDLPADGGASASEVELEGEAAVAVAAGAHHSCALMASGTVRCWGWNAYGQLGTGDTANRLGGPGSMPSTVSFGAPKAVAVAAGFGHTCAVLDTGSVRCWGLNDRGQLGAGHTNSLMDQPGEEPSTRSFGDDPAVELALGAQHTCARTAAGAVYCWGSNSHGQLGGELSPTGTSSSILDKPNEVPPLVDLGGPAVRIYAGGDETCALLGDEQVRCWGANDRGQLGIGSTTDIGVFPTPDAPCSTTCGMPPQWVTNAMGAAGAACAGDGAVCLSGKCTNGLCAAPPE